ncbi:MAG: transposase [Rhizobiales bacterium]|nr:transposase [Rhizobacter sp.]
MTGAERRRRWAPAEKARIVAESFAPDAIVADVARRHDVHANLLHLWRRQARLATGGAGRVNFLPVTVEPQKRSSGPSGGAIEIELDDGVRVRVDAAVDEAALGRVLRALGR